MVRHASVKIDWFDMPEVPYRASRLLKTMGNPKTYALVKLMLDEDTLTVEEMVAALNRPQPVVSQMLRALRDLEVVRYQRKGKHVFYTLKDRKPIAAVAEAAEVFAKRAAAGD